MPCRLGEALGCSAREVGPDGCRTLHTPQHHSGCSGTAREEKWERKNHWQLIQSVYNKHEHFKILAIFCTLRKLVHVHVDLQQIAALRVMHDCKNSTKFNYGNDSLRLHVPERKFTGHQFKS